MRPLNLLGIYCIRAYQLSIAPFWGGQCKFEPSCSHYACACLRSYGFFKGVRLSVWRILRCNPWTHGGYDPAVKPKQSIDT
jgi:putative membrane protein insertion efficiency factor